jgi:hypothetical protein
MMVRRSVCADATSARCRMRRELAAVGFACILFEFSGKIFR